MTKRVVRVSHNLGLMSLDLSIYVDVSLYLVKQAVHRGLNFQARLVWQSGPGTAV